MRLIGVTLLLATLLGVAALAQPAPFADVAANGKTWFTAAALDTLHSTTTKAAGVATAKWRGPITYYYPLASGAWGTKTAMPTRWHLMARKPFQYKLIYQNGDSSGLLHALVDTTVGNFEGSRWTELFPCQRVLSAQVRQIRIKPASSDTVYVTPQVPK